MVGGADGVRLMITQQQPLRSPHPRPAPQLQVVRMYSTSDGMQVATQRHSMLPVLAVDISPSGINGISCWCVLR